MFRKKWVIALIVILVLAAMGGAYFFFKKEEATNVNVEAVKKRDLEAIVTASGTGRATASARRRRAAASPARTARSRSFARLRCCSKLSRKAAYGSDVPGMRIPFRVPASAPG